MMYSKILVPLDGSELAACTLDHVKKVAPPGTTPEIILLRVVEPMAPSDAAAWSQYGLTMEDVNERNIAQAKEYLSLAVDRLAGERVAARSDVIEGRAAESILDYAEKNNVELIIIATHGRSGISRWAFGSVADRVAHHSNIPVMLITPKECRTKG